MPPACKGIFLYIIIENTQWPTKRRKGRDPEQKEVPAEVQRERFLEGKKVQFPETQAVAYQPRPNPDQVAQTLLMSRLICQA